MAGYFKNDDKLQLGDVRLEKITYLFDDDKFVSVYLRSASGATSADQMVNIFQTQFGRGAQPNRFIKYYLWNGDISVISLDSGDIHGTCEASITSTKYMDKRESDQNRRARGAKKDF